MASKAEEALTKLRDAFHEIVRELGPEDYREVMGQFSADLRGYLETLDEEQEDEDGES